jgi:radical SAM protein (TIGR01212 family)
VKTGEKRYNTFSGLLKREFGCRVHRISVDAGFTCPNRDGTVGIGGCIYCGGRGSGSHGILPDVGVREQLEHGKEVMVRKYKAQRFIAYFQAYSSTHAPVAHLQRLYDEALAVPDVVGLIVGTRPDCLPPEVLDLLGEYARNTWFWLELGMQSHLDRSLEYLGRGHDFRTFEKGVLRAKNSGLRICVHVILGLPGESREEMLAGAEVLNQLGVNGVKLHLLHVMKGTGLEELYRMGKVAVLERDEYVGLVCDYLELLHPDIIIQRLTGDGGHDHLIAPLWSLKKFEVLNAIDRELERRGTMQGAKV